MSINLSAFQKHFHQNQDLSAYEALATWLSPLAEVDGDLPQRILQYIFSGENPEILQELPQSRKNHYPIYRFLGVLSLSGLPNFDDKQSEEEKKRADLYTLRFKQLYPHFFTHFSLAQITRYSEFLFAINPLENDMTRHFAPNAPVPYLYLLIDALIYTRRKDVYGHTPFSQAELPDWTHENLLTLLKHQGIENPKEVLLEIWFERPNLKAWQSTGWNKGGFENLRVLFELPDTQAFFEQNLDLVRKKLGELSLNARRFFLNHFPNSQEIAFIQKYPFFFTDLAVSKDKEIRQQAVPLLSHLDNETVQNGLREHLFHGNSDQRKIAIEVLEKVCTDNIPLLEQALSQEKSKSIQQLLQSALQRLNMAVSSENALADLPIPPFQAIEVQAISDDFADVLVAGFQEIFAQKRRAAELEAERLGDNAYWYREKNEYEKWAKIQQPEIAAQAIINHLNLKQKCENDDIMRILPDWLKHKKILQKRPEFNLLHALAVYQGAQYGIFYFMKFLTAENVQHIDLRQLFEAMQRLEYKVTKRDLAEIYLKEKSYFTDVKKLFRQPEQVYPFFLENMDFLREAFGLIPPQNEAAKAEFSADAALTLLHDYFPSLPNELHTVVLPLALGSRKVQRLQAQDLLAKIPNVHLMAMAELQNSQQEKRVLAADWLGRLGNREAVQPLYELLKKEKKELVIAQILTALEKLGEDISAYLTPQALQKDAEKGLKGKLSPSFEWFNLANVPAAKWQNGETVEPCIVQWWFVLAEKLKDPKPNPLLNIYLNLLDNHSREKIGEYALTQFIAHDTLKFDAYEAQVYAKANVGRRLYEYQRGYYGAEKEELTEAEVEQELFNERKNAFVGSNIKSKGMLALANVCSGAAAAKMLRDFTKKHYARRAQIQAMLLAFSESNHHTIIQFLLSIARRYRVAGIQAEAKAMIEAIAERNGWTADELADRSIPSAGLDEQGFLHLDYGSRQFCAYVDAKDKWVLQDENENVIKALPAPRQSDDADLVKEAKSALSNAKKEWKQTLELQTVRLHEAMCLQRTWTSADWQTYLLAHPIMRRLVSRLVWLEMDENNGIIQSFRPEEDGMLLNADNDEIELHEHSRIQIAHRVLLDETQVNEWKTHFQDYKLAFLFPQMTHALPKFAHDDTLIGDKMGFTTDTFTLRGVVAQLGYQRGEIGDGGGFDAYWKAFGEHWTAYISFSGSSVPENNIPAVLHDLFFKQNGSSETVALSEVPRVLLAETYANYVTVASAASHFDAKYKR